MDAKSPSFRPGQFFGPYLVLAELARGGQGLVLQAQHPQGDLVALKVLLKAEGPAFKRFQKEVAVLERLRHSNLPRIVDRGLVDGRPFLAMQLVEGGSLSHRLKLRGPLPVEEAVTILSEIARVLEYCHSVGIYHRDLKPGNIVVDKASGRPFLVDFGIVKHESRDGAISIDGASRLSMTGEVVGTISYMAPEQSGDSDASVGPATDVYGLAATLFALWTGRPPFKGETAYNTLLAVIDQAPPNPRSLRPEIPARAAEVCLRGLAKLPQERPATPLAFVDELEAALSAPAPAGAGGGRGPLIAAGLAIALILFAVLGLSIPLPGEASSPAPTAAASSGAAASPRATPSPSASAAPPAVPSRSPPLLPSPRAGDLPVGQAGALALRIDSPARPRPLVRCGPWILMRYVDKAWAFKVQDLAAGPLALPPRSWPFGWDARARRLVFEREGESYHVGEDGQESPSPYPTGFGLVDLGRLRVAAFADGRLVAFDPQAPDPPAWTVRAERNQALPLPLDLDQDGTSDHLLLCTRGGRAILVSARGKVRFDVSLPSGVDQSAVLLESAGAAPAVLVACSGGVLLRCQVYRDELVEVSRVDLMEPLRGPAYPVFVDGEVQGIAVVVQHATLCLVDAAVRQVEWCARRSLQREVCLSGPAIVDLDRDGVPELAVARFTKGRGSQAWLEVYRLNGDWVTRLPAGSRDLRAAPGPAPLLLAGGTKGVWSWGPWGSLPEPDDAPLDSERVFGNLLGGAWAAVQRDSQRLGGVQDRVYSTLAARHLGQPDRRRELSEEDLQTSMRPLMNAYQHGVSKWLIHRLFAPPGHPRPDYGERQPVAVEVQPAGGRVGVELGETILGHGVDGVTVSGYDPERMVVGLGSWIRVEWTGEGGPRELVLRPEVYNVRGGGYDEIALSLDGEPLGVVSCYFRERGAIRLPLGQLSPGRHRLELEVRRSTAILRIPDLWIEPAR
jgi:protein kinase-like protein